jgi:hypothetical protein
MTGNQFNTLISILYVGYVLMQAPSYVPARSPSAVSSTFKSNMFLDRMARPSIYLSSCMVIWGTITLLTGAYYIVSFNQHHLTRATEGASQT